VRTLSDIAVIYDEQTKANDAIADVILSGLDSVGEEIREHKRWLADWLTAEAVELRARAEEVRKADWCRSRVTTPPSK
jgi:hypothetical protein